MVADLQNYRGMTMGERLSRDGKPLSKVFTAVQYWTVVPGDSLYLLYTGDMPPLATNSNE